MKKTFILTLIGLFICSASWAQIQEVSLSDSIGNEIDQAERDFYNLFPDIKGFQSARIVQLPKSKYRLNYTFQSPMGLQQKSVPISSQALELTKLHIRLTENYHRIQKSSTTEESVEAEILYRLALKYASQARYDVTSRLLSDLISDYPQTSYASKAGEFYATTEKLWQTKRALFWKGSLLDQSGRTDLLIFSGYYGLWLGIATPLSLKADSPQAYALGLLLGGPLSLLTTHSATKEANISDSRATMISLGGHWGTWQGIGWAAIAEMEGNEIVGMGELLGLVGITAATALTNRVDFSTGHAGLTSSGLQWGAWYGLVFAMLANHEENDILRDMLLGSDAFILGAGLTAKDVRMSKTRVRLINLAGVIGTVIGFGFDLLVEVDNASTAFAIAGLGSVAGLGIGTHITRDFDEGKELSLIDRDQSRFCYSFKRGEKVWSIAPKLALQRHPYIKNKSVPSLGLQITF